MSDSTATPPNVQAIPDGYTVCTECGGDGFVYWDYDDHQIEAKAMARDVCPKCLGARFLKSTVQVVQYENLVSAWAAFTANVPHTPLHAKYWNAVTAAIVALAPPVDAGIVSGFTLPDDVQVTVEAD